ncbi:MAG TPA: polysaccharide deacetylase family protein [Bacteroidales bacterium]|nr:polysaccharide deacetylase family protein [Bacteroidales bacterium]
MDTNDRKNILPIKAFIVLVLAGIVFFSGMVTAQEKGEGNINAFIYHRFGNSKYPSTNIDMQTFRQQLEYLHNNNYQVLPLGEAVKKIRSEASLPEKMAVLTVDDGYKSFQREAAPLLEEYGYKATVFVCTDYVGRSGYLSWEDIKSLRRKGHEFGNHSHSHAHFLNGSDPQTREKFLADLEKSEKIFKQQLGDTPDLFCYPYGEYNPGMQQILKKRGYRAATAQKSGVIHPGSDLFALPRFPMTSYYGAIKKFRSKAQMKALPVIKEEPMDPEIEGPNPPQMTLHIDASKINTNAIQCFVNGQRNCEIAQETNGSTLILKVRAQQPLETRRSKYTITAPSKSGSPWFWYSHLWVNTKYGE